MNELEQHSEGFRLSRQQADAVDAERRLGRPLTLRGTRRFDGGVELPRLAAALERVCARHEILRTVFRDVAGLGHPLQVIDAVPTYRLTEAAFDGGSERAPALTPSDSGAGAMLSVSVRRSEGGSDVCVLAPSSRLDESSMEALLAELEAALKGEETDGDPLQYVDYSEWQHELLQSDWGRQAQSFWASRQRPDALAATLPFERSAAAAPSVGVVELDFERLRPALSRLGSALDVTARDAFFCLWAAFAARAFGRNEVTIAVVADKQEAELEGALGRFARRIPVSCALDPAASLRQSLTAAHVSLAECMAWREAFVESSFWGHAEGLPSYALGFSYRELVGSAGDRRRTRVELDPAELERLRLEVVAGAEGTVARLLYRESALERATVEVWAEQFATFAGKVGADLEQPLRGVPLLGEAERRRILEQLVGRPTRPASEPRFLHQLFEAAARRYPERPAIVHRDVELSYGELERRAQQVARYLLARGVGPEEVVAVYAGRSCELIVALIGILQAGAAYLPLDPSYPAERLRMMVEDARVRRVLVFAPEGAAPELGDAESISLAEGSPVWQAPGGALRTEGSPSRLAYMIYTSGSTGRPKGVMVSHENAVASTRARFGFYDWDIECFLLLSSVSFDSSVAGIFWTLASGGRLCLPEDGEHKDASSIVELIRRRGVTHLLTLPSFYEQLLGELGSSRVRGVIVAGEACPAALARRHFEALPEVRLVNEYGPTEGSVWSTAWRLRAGDAGPVPIGRPIETMRAYVLDPALELAPIGATGELFIAGQGITRGYFGRPSLTAERFLPDPHGQPGERMYRTGDSVRFRPDGALEFFGRVDQQVKLRGYRIELGEIESRILEHPEVAEAAVAVRELLPGQGRLVAYVVPAARPAASDADAWRGLEERLREHLSSRLPEFMQPAHWVALAAFPQTPNGKIDRAALPEPAREATSEHVAPRDELEQRLADVWQQILQVERVGVHDNFFKLGGDSIVLLQVVALARQQGFQLTARDVFGHPTIATLAAFVAAERLVGPAGRSLHAELPLSPAQRWFFAEHGAAPDAQSQWRIFEPSERLDPERLERCLRQLVEQHDALRLSFARAADGSLRQAHVPVDVLHERWARAPLLEVCALDDLGALPARIDAARARLRLEEGRLLGALLVELGGAQRLVLIVHRLVVDPVSWQVLADDLGALVRDGGGDGTSLIGRSSPLASWAEALTQKAAGPELVAELDHWRTELFDARSETFPRDHDRAEYSAELAGLSVELDATLLATLLDRVCQSRRVSLEHVLLAAFARVLCRYGRKSSIVVTLERQRASRPFEGVELGRSVGWLSSHFPVRLRPEMHGVASGLSSVVKVKQQLASVPGGGLGYGVSKYLAAREVADGIADAAWPRAAFSFRQHDTPPEALLRPSALAAGPVSAGAPGAWLSLEAALVDDRLSLSWVYQRVLYREETIAALGRDLCAELEELAAQAAVAPPRAVEPSDFPLARLDRTALEELALDWGEIEDVLPLSPMQQGMLLHTLLEPGSGIYLMQDHYHIDSEVDATKLADAWAEVARRHSSLRAQFVWRQERKMLQVIRRDPPVPLEQLDYRGLDEAEQRRRLAALLRLERERGFDMGRAPLWALRLVRLGEARYELVISHHHIIMDGWSWGLVWLDVCAVYQDLLDGKSPRRPAAPSYREFIAWLEEKDPEAAARYWRAVLAGFEEATPLPFDRAPAPEAGVSRIDAVRSTWSEAETRALTELATRHGLTTNTFLQAAWALTLSRYSGRRDVLFGVTVAGRPPELPELQRAVGLFINTIPLRLSLPDERVRVSEFLQALLEQNVEMRQHEHLPLVRVQALSAIPKSDPLFHSLLVYENVPLDSSVLPHAQNLRVRAGTSRVHTNYPLTVMILPGRELALDLSFDERFFERATVARLLAELERWLRALIAGFERPLSELARASEAERRALLEHGRGPERRVRDERGYSALVVDRARRTPDRVVARCVGQSMTYAGLEARSAQVAAGLRARGVPLEGRVGVLVERGLELLAFALGTLRAGAVYVPLDPSHPPERLARTLVRAKIRAVLCSPATERLLRAALDDAGVAAEVEPWAPPAAVEGEAAAFADAPYAGPRSVAYVIHTSGSTGEPKGAMVEYAGMLNNVLGKITDLGLTEEDVIAQTASAAFDISVWQLLTGPACGARLEIVPDAIAHDPAALLRHVQATGITVLESVPSLIEAMLSEPAQPLPSLRWMITTGEAMSPQLARRWRERYPEIGLLNAYGPAECADDVALCRIEAPSAERLHLSIGRATDNNRLYVLDANLDLVPFGATGELCIAGIGPGRGYMDAPGHTARAFVPNPYAEEPGERLYRTGDLVRFEPDGSLAFVGRADHQVKIRGYRVELGEIEARLREHPAVKEGVVVAKHGAQGKLLVAYVVAAAEREARAGELKEHLARLLPRYMVPSHIVVLEQLPLNANGKLDRKALPDPELDAEGARQDYVAPITSLERTIAEIWSEVLTLERVGRHDDFFELGGHSLLGVQVIARLRRRTGRDVPLRALFEASVLARFAERAQEGRLAEPHVDEWRKA
ncbi:amino acid adenylation domain-containing protein [Sorangium sp. So ce134]